MLPPMRSDFFVPTIVRPDPLVPKDRKFSAGTGIVRRDGIKLEDSHLPKARANRFDFKSPLLQRLMNHDGAGGFKELEPDPKNPMIPSPCNAYGRFGTSKYLYDLIVPIGCSLTVSPADVT